MTDSSTKPILPGKPSSRPTLTGDGLADMVLDHMLDNPDLFVLSDDVAPNGSATEHFANVLESLKELARKVAVASMANRNNLSALPTMGNRIPANPDESDDPNLYEIRFRIVEQYGKNPPVKDSLYTYEEACEKYGQGFVEKYWGTLGEKCPSLVTTGQDRQIWFTAVRYPTTALQVDQAESMENLIKAIQPFGSTQEGQPQTDEPSPTGQRQRSGYRAPSLK